MSIHWIEANLEIKQKMSQFEEMGKAFVGFYYPAFAANRGQGSQLESIYTWVEKNPVWWSFFIVTRFGQFLKKKIQKNFTEKCFFSDQSCMSFEGAQFQGKAAIMGKF